MKLKSPPGNYILAVSGGVDSMALLDILSKEAHLKLTLAHFNHGMRADTDKDEQLVIQAAKKYNLPLKIGHGRLGAGASEAAARKSRYHFLEAVRRQNRADAIITAHHQDDLIETAILNLLRGTGPQGLIAIRSNKAIVRPLLDIPKAEILKYAANNRLKWREDPTNQDQKYARNYVRHSVLPGLKMEDRRKLVKNLDKVANIQLEKNKLLATLSRQLFKNNNIDRQVFINLPAAVSDEVLHYWLYKLNIGQIDHKTIRKLSGLVKTAKPGRQYPVNKQLSLEIDQKTALLRTSG